MYHTSAGTIAVGRIVSGSIGCFEQIRICPGPLDYENILADDDHDDTLIIPEEETDEEIEIRLALLWILCLQEIHRCHHVWLHGHQAVAHV